MTMTTVYGASDDLIEIEGALREEFPATADVEHDLLTFSNGVVIGVRYDDEGIWRITPIAGADKVTIWQCPADDPHDRYSDRAEIEGAAWVVCNDQFVKAATADA